MRTLLSIEEGFIPINAGVFNDHSLNKLTLNISPHSTIEDLSKLFFFIEQPILRLMRQIDRLLTFLRNLKLALF